MVKTENWNNEKFKIIPESSTKISKYKTLVIGESDAWYAYIYSVYDTYKCYTICLHLYNTMSTYWSYA